MTPGTVAAAPVPTPGAGDPDAERPGHVPGRTVDLLTAAVPCAEGLPLYTLDPNDFRGLHDLIDVNSV
jgi:hypothetical protein